MFRRIRVANQSNWTRVFDLYRHVRLETCRSLPPDMFAWRIDEIVIQFPGTVRRSGQIERWASSLAAIAI